MVKPTAVGGHVSVNGFRHTCAHSDLNTPTVTVAAISIAGHMTASQQQTNVHQLYKRLETVGKGAYGSVHKGIEIATGNVVALKIINLDTADDDVADIQREVALLTHLRDAVNITRYYGCYLDGPRVWIVMEYAQGGSVRTLMKACRDNVVQERYIVIITRELLRALVSLHKAGVIHRDIKAANILITAVGKVMLCDFGVSALLQTSTSKRNTLVGTPYWMAPEVAQPVPNYDTKADIWSLGITIYEMVTGSPPHSNLDGLKVVQLIPRSKPPRLSDNEGTKDLREFVASCLRESPGERPPAEELLRSKWIKATAKTQVSILTELLTQYEAWKSAGGTRASIADPLPWEEEEEEDMNPSERQGTTDNEPWEFDTVRANSVSGPDATASPHTEDPGLLRSPPVNARVPNSLRGLFGDVGPPQLPPDPFRTQDAWPRSNTPTLVGSSQSQSPPQAGPSRGRTTPRRAATTAVVDESGSDDTARQNNFVFPPRPGPANRLKSKLSSSVPPDDENSMPLDRTAKPSISSLNASHGRGIGDATMSSTTLHPGPKLSSSSDISDSGGNTVRTTPNYREVRTSRGVPNISIPPANLAGSLDMMSNATLGVANINLPLSDDIPPATDSPQRSRPLFGRKRSQSSAAASSSSSSSPVRPRNKDPAFPHDFHFPPVSATTSHAGPVLPLPILSPSQKSTSSNDSGRSPAAHHTAHSLDAFHEREFSGPPVSAGSGFISSNGSLGLPTVISRAHSANALSEGVPATTQNLGSQLPRRMSITRQASVAVMEGVGVGRISPAISSTGVSPERSEVPVPGLKDVLKIPSFPPSEMRIGMTDLLPPSPSAASANRRFFAPTPSSLSTSMTPSDTASILNSSQPQGSPSFDLSLGVSRTAPSSPSLPQSQILARPTINGQNVPSPAERQATDNSVVTSSSSATNTTSQTRTHSYTTSSASSVTSLSGGTGLSYSLSSLPPLRPLDFSPLLASHEATHTALAQTVDELIQCLGVVEAGLSAVLSRTTPAPNLAVAPGSAGTDTFLEQVFEDEEEDEIDMGRIGGTVEEGSDLKLESDDSPSEREDKMNFVSEEEEEELIEGSFEQFLARNMQQKNKGAGNDLDSTDENVGSNIGHSVLMKEQPAASVTS